MHSLFATASQYVHHYGYYAIFFGVLLENFGAPLPGETLIIVGGLFAAKGILNLGLVIFLGTLAAFVGWDISYAVGIWGGRRLLVKFGRFIFMNEQRIQALEKFVHRHGNKIIIWARFFIGLRQFSGFIAGTLKMPLAQFFPLNAFGSLLWVGWWACAAFYLSRKLEVIFTEYNYFENYFLIALAAAVLIAVVYHLIKKSREKF